MKKLLSFLAVAAIVTSAFAFATKGVAEFCIRNGAGTACVVQSNKKIVSGTTNFKIYPLALGQWDGSDLGCTSAGTANCSVDIRLEDN